MIVTKESAKTLIKLFPITSRHYNTVLMIAEGVIDEKDIIDLNPEDIDDLR